MEKEINIVFHNHGLRSFIEVDLCAECPRQDDKGCCGFYSPVFYPTDLVYLLLNQPDLLDYIFSLDHLTILDASVTVNNTIEGPSYRCKFHSKEKGCILSQSSRESVCRHFVCPDIGLWEDEEMKDWHKFFEKLTDFEIQINNQWADELKEKGLSLRDPSKRKLIYDELKKLYARDLNKLPDFIVNMPQKEARVLTRPIKFGLNWKL